MTRTPIFALLVCLAAIPLAAQTQHPPRRTVAQLGTCSASGIGGPRFVIVTDGASATDCTTGGGSTAVPCWCDGSAWTVLAGGGGGATELDDLTDVSTTGAEIGEALIFGGATWGASVAPVMLAGDAPTAHGASHEDGGADELDLTGLAGLTATPQTPAAHVHGAGDLTSGTLAHERGGLEADVSAYGGLVRIAAGATSAVTNLAGLNTAIGASLADGAHTVDTDDQDAAAVPYTPTTGADWTDPDPTSADEAFDALAGRLTAEEGKADDDVPESGDFGALALSGDVTSSGLVTTLAADTVGLAELAACPGPGEIVEYGASGVPSCIATPSGGGSGDVVGPASATDNAIARYDLATGKLLQNSSLIVGDTGVLSVAGGGAHQFTNSSAANRLYIDDFDHRLFYGGAEFARLGQPAMQLRSDQHFQWSSTFGPTGTKDTGFKRCAAGVACATDGSTGAGSLSSLMAQLVPQASAPACPTANAGLYFDSSGSGALCACPPGGAWAVLLDFGSGNCT